MVDTLADPYGSEMAFLSDLHEQVEGQIISCPNATLRAILVDLRTRIEVAALLVMTAAKA